ncbi:BOLA class I histocompatibility antigen, alpha chain BL3-7-like isoform X2 [Silurus meridionalis]|uniref:BOLA class I histocompatibility antigen, alpha chain BL3-7-like isoform X2 n=1 Tax=Silurus meridionalis TaxID=175797 RepID=UPI001EEBC1EC|nr:BOLA class I histocompatibility antigen, alpha chain BL3-7-like isoform X2 [Silurus meridionalis]
MKVYSDAVKALLFLSLVIHSASADTHSLQFLFTVVKEIKLPDFIAVGLVDGEQYVYYDSNIRKAILKTEWIKKFDANVHKNWIRKFNQDNQAWFQHKGAEAMKSFNHTKGGLYTVQYMHGCELDDDGTTRAYYQDAYNGEDLISLDLNSENWITTKPQAEIIKNKWEATGHGAKYCKNYLQHECVETLRNFLSHSREILERKVHPETSLFWKHSSPPEVVCDATGFFPKALLISWQKDGEDVYEDVELRETLPNQDGSFQKRSILKVSAEELQKHTYTCVIEHSSLEKDLVLPVSERRILRDGGLDGGSGGGQIGIIIICVVVALAVLVVAGIFIWKKKQSGFKSVPARASSEGDSSSNNS